MSYFNNSIKYLTKKANFFSTHQSQNCKKKFILKNVNFTFQKNFHVSSKCFIDFNPYNVLNVSKDANEKEIKKAYYESVKKYHPDVNKDKDAQSKFHKIQESYEILNDKKKRQMYDKFGSVGYDSNGNTNSYNNKSYDFNFHGGNPFNGMGFDFEDLFKEAFNKKGTYKRESYVTEHIGDNIEIQKTILFKESIFGTTLKVNYKSFDSCSTCRGLGLKAGKKKSTCYTCHGSGQNVQNFGGLHMSYTCKTCNGSGMIITDSDKCLNCKGHGVEQKIKTKNIDIPCGISDGSRIKIYGAGDAPFITKDIYNKTMNGDLIIKINIAKDLNFSRSNNDIIVNKDILMTTAMLGGKITIPTIDGQNINLIIRSGTQNGHKVKVPNKGVPINRNLKNRGDLIVFLNVKILAPESSVQKALSEALADVFNDKTATRTNSTNESDESILKNVDNIETYDEKDLNNSKLKKIGKFLGKFFNFDESKNLSNK